MQCPEQLLGAETYFLLIVFAVGAVVNLVKRIKWMPGDATPVLAFMLGWAIDAAVGNFSCGLNYTAASISGLGGGLAGLAAAGGHEALARTAGMLGLGSLATKLLGKAKGVQDERKKTPPSNLLVLIVIAMSLGLSGCASLLPALAKAAQGAQYLGTVIEMADAGADTYFARHPNLEAEHKVNASVRAAHGALTTLNAALAASQAASDEDVVTARTEALKAYGDLRALLADLGVLSATPPAGGAETDAPAPEPFALPRPEAVMP